MKLTTKDVTNTGLEFYTILEFINRYSIDYTVEAVGYHMLMDKIDWMQPGSDRFVVLTVATLNYYGIEFEII